MNEIEFLAVIQGAFMVALYLIVRGVRKSRERVEAMKADIELSNNNVVASNQDVIAVVKRRNELTEEIIALQRAIATRSTFTQKGGSA